MQEVDGLNERLAIDQRLRFARHSSGLIQGLITTPLCRGEFFLQGGHITHFEPQGEQPLLFLSRHSEFQPQRPIRGGIPICFPWFGPHPSDAAAPAHGLVRTLPWDVQHTQVDQDEVVTIFLTAASPPWQLTYKMKLGRALDLTLDIANLSDEAASCEIALHTYLALADVDLASVHGLERQTYYDKLTREMVEPSGVPIRFTQETDRIYRGPVDEVIVHDPGNRRLLRLVPRNSHSTVIWNPWVEKSRRLPDFGDDEFRFMCCVETANVAEDRLAVPAKSQAELGVTLSVSPAPGSF